MEKVKLIRVENSSKDAYTFHAKTIVKDKEGKKKEVYLEFLCESVYNHRLGLVCSNRWHKVKKKQCSARWSLDLIGLSTESYKTEKGRIKHKIVSEDEERKKLKNYGEFLTHNHTKRCTGNLN